MKIKSAKEELKFWYGMLFFIPIIFTVLYFVAWYKESGQMILLGIIAMSWVGAILLSIKLTLNAKKNPYPFHYLVDYNTLVEYLKTEEQLSIDNKLEAGFHIYIFNDKEKIQIQSWHHSFSSIEKEKNKGNIIYYNNEEINSFEEFINNKLPKFENYILIELVGSDNVKLNEYKKNHPELDVISFIEKLNEQL